MERPISVMVVSADEFSAKLIYEVERQGGVVLIASHRRHFLRTLDAAQDVDLLIVDDVLPDGDWRQVLDDMVELGKTAKVFVHTDCEPSQSFRQQLLDHGVLAVLVGSYDAKQVEWLLANKGPEEVPEATFVGRTQDAFKQTARQKCSTRHPGSSRSSQKPLRINEVRDDFGRDVCSAKSVIAQSRKAYTSAARSTVNWESHCT